MNENRSIFSHLDKVLMVCGILGFVLYGVLIPKIHPDGAPTEIISREEAITRAEEFIRSRGYSRSSLTWEAFLHRETSLLDTLGEALGAVALVDGLRNGSIGHLPLYYWQVTGQTERERNEDAGEPFIVNVSAEGVPWSFSSPSEQRPGNDAEALRYAIEHTANLSLTGQILSVDSLLQKELLFRLPPLRRGRPQGAGPSPPDGGRPPPELRIVSLTDTAAQSIAEYHLQNTLLARYNLTADTVYRPAEFENDQVRVRFSAPPISPGEIPFNAHVDVYANGALGNIRPAFQASTPIAETPQRDQFSLDLPLEYLPEYLLILSYIALAVLSLVLFVRRLSARLIDVKSAMQDAIWGAIFLGGMAANQIGWNILRDTDTLWSGILLAGLFSLVSASLGAFLIFMISCGTDSIARFVWPEKVTTLSMARNLQFRNVPVGRAFVHGIGVAGVLLGIQALLLLLPGAAFSFDDGMEMFASESAFSPLGVAVFSNGGFSMLFGMTVLLGIGSLLYTKRRARFVPLVGVTIVFMLLQLGPVNVTPIYAQWTVSATIGFIVAIAFMRLDYVTAFIGLLFSSIIWDLTPGWLQPASNMLLDAWIAIALIAGSLILGFIGLLSHKDFSESEQFAPAYLKEIAQQERLKSELDIATQVQESLLPHRMPEMRKLDIAAMCLPAQEVGGDYFDFIRIDDHRLALIVGDVSGKGIQAAFYMTLTKGFIHAICHDEESPARVLTRVNHLFCQNAPRGTFISLIYGIIDVDANTFTFARAGHDPVILRAAGNSSEFIKPTGIAIGLTASSTFEQNIDDHTVDLTVGDMIVLYTDGVTEAVNPHREQFGTERLLRMVNEAAPTRASMILQNLSQRLQLFVQSAGRHDDMTLIVVCCTGEKKPANTGEPNMSTLSET